MDTQIQKQIINKNFDLIFIKFPIIFPLIYGMVLFTFPQYENILIFATLLLLAEPHFGATWPFFLNKTNFNEIKNKKIQFIFGPISLVIFCFLGFFYINYIFLFFFFALNIFHVTRQSFGICKLYKTNENEIKYQEIFIYIFNFLFFVIGIFRFYVPIINEGNIFFVNMTILSLLALIFIFYFIKFKNVENLLTLITGVIIFLPICFVDKPIHAIVMGVTMHYTQYLALTYKISSKRNSEKMITENVKSKFFGVKNYMFIFIVITYGIFMALLSAGSSSTNEIFKSLLVIPITGQILHFYLDAYLWKFSIKHNREVTLKHIYS
tara:strand:- start:2091 stop:3059 length:969 start_codon:yes stop_codon:yes gene_type:complete